MVVCMLKICMLAFLSSKISITSRSSISLLITNVDHRGGENVSLCVFLMQNFGKLLRLKQFIVIMNPELYSATVWSIVKPIQVKTTRAFVL